MIANLKHAIRNNETVSIGGGTFSPEELKAFVTVFDDLLDAAYRTFPIVQDSEKDSCYKAGYITSTIKTINAAISAAERI